MDYGIEWGAMGNMLRNTSGTWWELEFESMQHRSPTTWTKWDQTNFIVPCIVKFSNIILIRWEIFAWLDNVRAHKCILDHFLKQRWDALTSTQQQQQKGTIKVLIINIIFFFSLLFSFFGLFFFCCYECDFDSGKPIMNKPKASESHLFLQSILDPLSHIQKPPNPKSPIFLAVRFINVYMHNDAHNQISVPFLSLSHLVSSLANNFLSSIRNLFFY